MTDPSWALPTGLPSVHLARAALHAAAIVGRRGSRIQDASESHWHRPTGGVFSPQDLRRGEQLLLDLGLLVDVAGVLTPSSALNEIVDGSPADALASLAARALELTLARSPVPGVADEGLAEFVPDPLRREQLLLALGQRFDNERRLLVGEIGEELVTTTARDELRTMGQDDLARAVRRVSLVSDQLGYDVTAPTVGGGPRLLEVKASAREPWEGSIGVFLSRNEHSAGLTLAGWSLVICIVHDVTHRTGRILGWCSAFALEDLLPTDASTGRWEQAWLLLPVARLVPGLPGPVA